MPGTAAPAPLFDEFSDAMSFVGAEVIHNHNLSRPQAWGEHFFEVSLENTSRSVAPSTARAGPIPSTLTLASKVVFFPRLRGTEQSTLAFLYVTKHAGQKGKCSPPSRPRKPAAAAPPSRRPSPSRLLSATRLVPPPPYSVFSTEAKTLQQSSDGGGAQRLARCASQEAAPLEERGGRTLLYVFFE